MKEWFQEIMQKSARKWLTHLTIAMPRKCPPINGSSNIPLFDRDRLNGDKVWKNPITYFSYKIRSVQPVLLMLLSIIPKKFPLHQLVNSPFCKMSTFLSR